MAARIDRAPIQRRAGVHENSLDDVAALSRALDRPGGLRLLRPLVFSVHSVVSFDFATSQLPGWHTTIFPPYFVAGAIFSGFAMVLTLLLPLRHLFNLQHIIKESHIEAMCKIMLATGMMVG